MSHLLYIRVSLTADTTYFMEIACLQLKNQQESKLEGVIKQACNAEYLCACKSFRVTSPVFSSAAVQREMAPSLTKMKVGLFGTWHLTQGDLSRQHSQLPSQVEGKNTWYNQKQDVLQKLSLPQMFLFLGTFIKFLFRLQSDRSQTFSFKHFHFQQRNHQVK